MINEETFQKLSQMKMHGFATSLAEQLESKKNYNRLSFDERVGLLVDV